MFGSRIHRNSAYSFISSAVRMGTNMLMFIGIARLYGPEAFGQFTTAHVYLTLFLYLADFGFDLLLATEVAHDKANAQALLERFFPLKVLAGILATAGMCVTAVVTGVSASTMLLMLVLSAALIGTTLTTSLFALCRGFEQLHHEARVTTIQQACIIALLVVLGLLHVPIVWIAVAFVASRILGLVLILRTVRLTLGVHVRLLSFQRAGETFLQGLPWGVHLVFGALYFQVDTLLLSAWRGDQSAGVYQSAMKLAVVVLVIPDVVIGAVLPTFARLYSEDRRRWEQLGRLVSRTLMYASLPFSLIFVLYPGEVLSLVYGKGAFGEAAPVLRLLGAVIFVRFAVETFALALTTTRHQTIRMWIVVAVTVLNIALNAQAIPRFGVVGAATVSLISNLVSGILYIIAARKVGFGVSLLAGSRSMAVLTGTALLGAGLVSIGGSLAVGLATAVIGCSLLVYMVGYTPSERGMVIALRRGAAREQ